ncbi:MAG: AbrB/MazE/SpoVT family DNA-binding domain-containing protein [Patescibacteria group bacterium]
MLISLKTKTRKDAPSPIGRIGQRRQVVIPKRIYDELGLRTGDFVEVRRVKSEVVIRPKKVVDRDDGITPQQRVIIDTGLAEAEKDIRDGRVSPPFRTVAELKRHLHAVRL